MQVKWAASKLQLKPFLKCFGVGGSGGGGGVKCLVFKFSRILGLNAPGPVYTPKSRQIVEFKTLNVSLLNKAWAEIPPAGIHHNHRHERGM